VEANGIRFAYRRFAQQGGYPLTSYSIAAALPLLALSFFLLVPMFLFVARETTRKELADFAGPKELIAPFQPALTGRRRSV
jgi:hypothetical protein